MLKKSECTLYSGGLRGAEAAFGESAARHGIKEVNFTFAGQNVSRQENMVVLSDGELAKGDISMDMVSKMMNRTYYESNKIRKVLQTIFHMVNNGHQVFAIGSILADNTVKGGTGWAVELAKFFNRPVSVFDQSTNHWYSWKNGSWEKDTPQIQFATFVGSGTRNLTDEGRLAIDDLFAKSFED